MDIRKEGIYQVCNGTYYHQDTKKEVIQWLETSRERKQRIRIFYGSDGTAWNEENDVLGHVGRSTGTTKIPLLIYSARSMGGGAILDNRIIRIDTKASNGKIVAVYQDNSVKFDHFSIGPSDMEGYHTNVINDITGEIYARCKTYKQGVNLADFMNGKRWSK